MPKLDMKLYAWVLRGSQRREIIKYINGVNIPAMIYKECIKDNDKITRNSVSDALRQFVKKKIAICINPEEKKGRIYDLTGQGKLIKGRILSKI